MKKPFKIALVCSLFIATAALAATADKISPLQFLKDKSAPALNVTTPKGDRTLGGPFKLTDHNGKHVTEADFAGKYMLVFFGFTHCPDICPTQLQSIKTALGKIGDKAKEVTPVLISVDPERDTPEVLKDYVASFPGTVGLTGSPGEIDKVAAHYKVYYKKSDDIYWAVEQQLPAEEKAKIKNPRENHYMVDHSAYIFLMAPDGAFITLFSFGTPPEEMAATLDKEIG